MLKTIVKLLENNVNCMILDSYFCMRGTHRYDDRKVVGWEILINFGEIVPLSSSFRV